MAQNTNQRFRKALLLINPASRAASDADYERAVACLAESDISVLPEKTQSSQHAKDLIREHSDSIDLVIIAGGDGTLSAVIDTLAEHQLAFAVFPLGTANDLARSLDLPLDIEKICEAIKHGRRRKIDLGKIGEHYFINAVTMGLGPKITQELSPELKRSWGVFSYVKAFFSAISKRRGFRVYLKADGKEFKLRSMHLVVGNGRFYGGGNVVNSESQIDDGLLQLYSLRPQSTLELLTLTPLLRTGYQSIVDRTFALSAKEVRIETKKPMELHADGEPLETKTPISIKNLPLALEAVVPPEENNFFG